MCGHKDTGIAKSGKENTTTAHKLVTPTQAMEFTRWGGKWPTLLNMVIVGRYTDSMPLLSFQPPKASEVHPRLTALRRASHFLTPPLRSQNKLASFFATSPRRTKQATNYTVFLSSPPHDLPTTISVNSKPLFTDFR